MGQTFRGNSAGTACPVWSLPWLGLQGVLPSASAGSAPGALVCSLSQQGAQAPRLCGWRSNSGPGSLDPATSQPHRHHLPLTRASQGRSSARGKGGRLPVRRTAQDQGDGRGLPPWQPSVTVWLGAPPWPNRWIRPFVSSRSCSA